LLFLDAAGKWDRRLIRDHGRVGVLIVMGLVRSGGAVGRD